MTGEMAGARPVTYHGASSSDRTWLDARDRYDELSTRHHLARATAALKTRSSYDPTRHEDHAALTLSEHLEVLANGEVVARVYRHPAQVEAAVQAGATWEQIAEATGSTQAQARAEYRKWADSQHRLWQHNNGRLGGLDDTEHAAAIARSGPAAAEAAGGDEDQAAVILTALDEAATLIRQQAALCLACETHPAELCEEHAGKLRRADAYDTLARRVGGIR